MRAKGLIARHRIEGKIRVSGNSPRDDQTEAASLCDGNASRSVLFACIKLVPNRQDVNRKRYVLDGLAAAGDLRVSAPPPAGPIHPNGRPSGPPARPFAKREERRRGQLVVDQRQTSAVRNCLSTLASPGEKPSPDGARPAPETRCHSRTQNSPGLDRFEPRLIPGRSLYHAGRGTFEVRTLELDHWSSNPPRGFLPRAYQWVGGFHPPVCL